MKPLITSLLPFFLSPLLCAQEKTTSVADASGKMRQIEQKVLLDHYQIALGQLTGLVNDGDTSGEAVEHLDKRAQWVVVLETDLAKADADISASREEILQNANDLNKMAWNMLVSPDKEVRNPEIALKLATIAIELGKGDEDLAADVLDTKARALFMTGKHGEAIELQKAAIAACGDNAELKANHKATLAAYLNGDLPDAEEGPATRDIVKPASESPAGPHLEVAQESKTAEDDSKALRLNEIAWGLLTAPGAGVEQALQALKMSDEALTACGPDDSNRAAFFDTQARALFMIGSRQTAIEKQQKAVDACEGEGPLREELEATLSAYKKGVLPTVK